ncbi:MAG: sodium:calcium antiporter [Conexivisphaera sp.]
MLLALSLLGGVSLTLAASALFTDAAERLGARMELGSSFVGSVISPLFTSAPELVVLLVSVLLYGGAAGDEVGAGTVLGEPLLISTVSAPALLLAAVAGQRARIRGPGVRVDAGISIPFAVFASLYPLVLLPAAIPASRTPVAAALLAGYAIYVGAMSRRMGPGVESEGPAWLERSLGVAGLALQLASSVPLLTVGSYELVASTVELSGVLRIQPVSLSMILVPLATALPETASSLIWAYRGRDNLAVGALVGEMVMFSTVYPALGILLTGWRISAAAALGVIVTELSSITLLLQARSGRLGAASALGTVLYAAYAASIVLGSLR